MSYPGLVNVGITLSNVDTAQAHPLGQEVIGVDGAIYRYVQATAAITAGDALVVDTASSNSPNAVKDASAVSQALIGVTPVTIPANSFGWIVTRGPVSASCATGTTAGMQLGSSAVAGQLAQITVAATPTQVEVQQAVAAACGVGIFATGAVASGLAPVIVV